MTQKPVLTSLPPSPFRFGGEQNDRLNQERLSLKEASILLQLQNAHTKYILNVLSSSNNSNILK